MQAALNNAAANLAALEAAGPQAMVDYSADGESYQFTATKAGYLAAIEKYQRLIAELDGPWILRMRGR